MPELDWLEHAESRKQFAELLKKAGLPLELTVWQLASQFRERHKDDLYEVFIEKSLYDNGAGVLREVDLTMSFHQDVVFSDHFIVHVQLQIPMECKFRLDVKAFGFERPAELGPNPAYVIQAETFQSRLFPSLIACPEVLRANTLGFGLVEIDKSGTPRRIHEENLIFKAGAALYDFVQHDIHANTSPVLDKPNSLLQKKVAEYIRSLDWLMSDDDDIVDWLYNNSTDEEIRQLVLTNPLMMDTLQLYIPILCINGEVYLATPEAGELVTNFEEKQFLVSALRPSNWPREVPIAVTNPAGLVHLIGQAAAWFKEVVAGLTSTSIDVVQMAPLEARFRRLVLSALESANSDSDSAAEDALAEGGDTGG